MSPALAKRLFACAAAAVIGCESYAVARMVTERRPNVRIEGHQRLMVDDFGRGVPFEQAFMMRGDGLRGVSVLLSADRPSVLQLSCVLRQLYDDPPGAHADIYQWTTSLGGVSETGWHRIEFPPLMASNGRHYSFRLQVVTSVDGAGNGSLPTSLPDASRPKIAIAASADHVTDAGPFLVGGGRWGGSLFLQAHAVGETAYDQFRLTTDTRLPRPLRSRFAQACLVIAYNWALLTYAYAMLVGGFEALHGDDANRQHRATVST